MKKYKLLRFGHYYTNKDGSFSVVLLGGSKGRGYHFFGSHSNPIIFLRDFYLLSRIVPNDGNWIEIDGRMFAVASQLHASGYNVNPSIKY